MSGKRSTGCDVAPAVDERPATGVVRRDRQHAVFELVLGDEVVGRAPYRSETGGVIVVPYVEIDRARRGQGLGAVLADGLLGDIRAEGELVEPACSWLAGHVRAHPEHHDLVARRP